MTTIAFVMLKVETGKIPVVMDELAAITEVNEAYPITGNYDVIARVEMDALSDLGKLVKEKIQTIEGVKKSSTSVALQ